MQNKPEKEVVIKQGLRLLEYVSMIRRRYLTVLIVLLSVFLSVFFYIWQLPNTYQSYTTLVLEESKSAFALAGMVETGRPIGYYQGILNSRSYLLEALDSIGPNLFKEVLPSDKQDTLTMLSYIRDNLVFGSSSFQSLMQFSAVAHSAELAYQLAKVGTDVFRKKCVEVETEQSVEALKQIKIQLDNIQKNLETVEKEYQAYRDKTGISEEGVDSELKNLQDMYYKERAQRIIKDALYEATKNQLELLESKITPVTVNETSEVRQLRDKLRELEKERKRLLSLNLSLPENSALQNEIDAVEKRLLYLKGKENTESINPLAISQWQALRSEVASQELEIDFSKIRLISYKKSMEEYKQQHPELLEQMFELSRIARAKKIYEDTHNILMGKEAEIKIRNASQTGGIKLIDPAYKPTKPISKNARNFYLAGIIIGLALGIGLALFLELNDTTIKSSEDIEKNLKLSVIGTIPHIVFAKNDTIDIQRVASKSKQQQIKTQYPKNLIDFNTEESIASEAYRSLRTNLLYASPDKPLKSILFTSSGPGEGKSLTIANVALAFSQMGSKVLLIDTDLRRPVVHHIFQVKREPGFSELFLHNTEMDKIIRPTQMQNLFIIPAGRFTPNPAELLGAKKMDDILEQLKTEYDMIFFDAPPLVAVTDAAVLSKKVDGVVLVVKSRKTELDITTKAAGILENVGTKIVGAVLNDIDLSHRYSSYGYYKYYYHYYRSKKD